MKHDESLFMGLVNNRYYLYIFPHISELVKVTVYCEQQKLSNRAHWEFYYFFKFYHDFRLQTDVMSMYIW